MEWIKTTALWARGLLSLLYEELSKPHNALFILLLFMISRRLASQSCAEAANDIVSTTGEFRSAVYDKVGIIFALHNLFWDTVRYSTSFILSLFLEPLDWLLAF